VRVFVAGVACFAFAFAFAFPAPARAEERAPSFVDRPLVLEGVLGLGTPVGAIGAVARLTPLPWVSFGVGGGLSPSGKEYAVLVLGRIPISTRSGLRVGVDVGGAYSAGGTYSVNPNPGCPIEDCRAEWTQPSYSLGNAHWLNLDVGMEVQFPSGFSLRAFAGIAKLANPGAARCEVYTRTTDAWAAGPCTPPINEAGRAGGLLPDVRGPSNAADVLFVLGAAVGYAIDLSRG
jgi:hypothetical protein